MLKIEVWKNDAINGFVFWAIRLLNIYIYIYIYIYEPKIWHTRCLGLVLQRIVRFYFFFNLDFEKSYIKVSVFLHFFKNNFFENPRYAFEITLYLTRFSTFYFILLQISIFGDFPNIYQFSTKSCMTLGHLNGYSPKSFQENFSKILGEDVKLMDEKVCQVSRWYLQLYGRYSWKTEGVGSPHAVAG